MNISSSTWPCPFLQKSIVILFLSSLISSDKWLAFCGFFFRVFSPMIFHPVSTGLKSGLWSGQSNSRSFKKKVITSLASGHLSFLHNLCGQSLSYFLGYIFPSDASGFNFDSLKYIDSHYVSIQEHIVLRTPDESAGSVQRPESLNMALGVLSFQFAWNFFFLEIIHVSLFIYQQVDVAVPIQFS